jgi:hypothetical protein
MSAPKHTPLHDLLLQIPTDIRIGVPDGEGWQAGTSWHPVGVLCHEASAELRRLHSLNSDLLQALNNLVNELEYFPSSITLAHAKVAIAKAGGAE